MLLRIKSLTISTLLFTNLYWIGVTFLKKSDVLTVELNNIIQTFGQKSPLDDVSLLTLTNSNEDDIDDALQAWKQRHILRNINPLFEESY